MKRVVVGALMVLGLLILPGGFAAGRESAAASGLSSPLASVGSIRTGSIGQVYPGGAQLPDDPDTQIAVLKSDGQLTARITGVNASYRFQGRSMGRLTETSSAPVSRCSRQPYNSSGVVTARP